MARFPALTGISSQIAGFPDREYLVSPLKLPIVQVNDVLLGEKRHTVQSLLPLEKGIISDEKSIPGLMGNEESDVTLHIARRQEGRTAAELEKLPPGT